MNFARSEKLLRYFAQLSEECGGEVSTALPHGDKWLVLRVEVTDEKPELVSEEDEIVGAGEA